MGGEVKVGEIMDITWASDREREVMLAQKKTWERIWARGMWTKRERKEEGG